MKSRFSITLSPELQRELDALVDGVTIRSRSEAIEKIVQKYIQNNKAAVILCGGNPQRYLVRGTYRPLVPVHGRPLIHYTLAALKHGGFHHVYIVGANKILSELFKVVGNGRDLGMKIEYTEDNKNLGELKTLQVVEEKLKAPFLFMQMDSFFTFNVLDIYQSFIQNKSLLELAVHARGDATNKKGFIEMAGNRIVSYSEEKSQEHTTLASCSIGICDPAIFRFIPHEDVRFTKADLWPVLIQSHQICGTIVNGPWFNIHTEADADKVEAHLKKHPYPFFE